MGMQNKQSVCSGSLQKLFNVLKFKVDHCQFFFFILNSSPDPCCLGTMSIFQLKSESAPEGCIVLLERTINNYHDEMATKETEPGGPLGSQPRQMDYNTRLGHQHGLQDHAGQKHTRSLHTHTHNAHRQYRSANEEPANHRPSLCQDQ